jgi:uncharacterized protein YjbJ (UPF0337 family)
LLNYCGQFHPYRKQFPGSDKDHSLITSVLFALLLSVLAAYFPYKRKQLTNGKLEGEVIMDSTQDIFFENWDEIKGEVKKRWSRLNEDDFARLTGKMEELAFILRLRYGYGKAQAELEIKNWLKNQTHQTKR